MKHYTMTFTQEELDILQISLTTSERFYDQSVAAEEEPYYARSLTVTRNLLLRLKLEEKVNNMARELFPPPVKPVCVLELEWELEQVREKLSELDEQRIETLQNTLTLPTTVAEQMQFLRGKISALKYALNIYCIVSGCPKKEVGE